MMMWSSTLRRRVFWTAVVLGSIAVIKLVWNLSRDPKPALMALSAQEAAALCFRERYPLDDFLERAKAIGVGAVFLRDQTLASASERGEILSFSRHELEKWRALGLIAPGAAIRPNSLWVKDSGLAVQVVESAAREGVAPASSTSAGYLVLEFPQDFDWRNLSAGVDSQALLAASKHSLFPAFEGSFQARVLSVEAPASVVLRAAFGGPGRLLVWRLSPILGVEKNLDLLRGHAQELKKKGAVLAVSESNRGSPRKIWTLFVWVLAIGGPLISVRMGLRALRVAKTFAQNNVPVASPVLELVAGMSASALTAIVTGLVVQAAGGVPVQKLAAASLPLVLGFLAMYFPDWPEWKRRMKNPISFTDILAAGLLAGGIVFVLWPAWALRQLGLEQAVLNAPGLPWWLPWRFREIFIGFPCLIQAFDLLNRRWDCPDCDGSELPSERARSGLIAQKDFSSDPRGWLLLGMLGPVGLIMAMGNGGMPLWESLGQAILSSLIGALFGSFLVTIFGQKLIK